MPLRKLKDLDPNYLDSASENMIGLKVSLEETGERVGSVKDVLVDESDCLRYLVVDFGLLIFNKVVMLPVDCTRADYDAQQVYVFGFTRKQVEDLPEFSDRLLANDDPEKTVDPVKTSVEQPTVSWKLESTELEATANNRKKNACLVFNPVAGQSDPEADLAIIRRILQPRFNLDICLTTESVGASQLAQKAIEQGAEIIIASGGDGTLSEAAEAVVGTGVPLGIISRGTANAFATALGIPIMIEAACETILAGKTHVVDAAYCNGKPMVLLAGIGFEAETVERADREAKNRFGMLAYVLAGIQELRDLKSFETRIETEDKVISLDAVAVTIANAAPPTSVLAQGPAALIVDDGLLDVTIVAPANRVGAIAAAYNLLQSARSAATTDRPDTGFLRAKSIKVTTNPPQKVVLDGELIGYTPVEVNCVPGGLTILAPATPEESPVEKLEGLPNLHVEFKTPPAVG